MLRFLLNNNLVNESDLSADVTVLDYLREQQSLCGTKEGCASGDCGACTAVVADIVDGQLRYRSINTCITLLGSLHGRQLITVEHLQDEDSLHPVQQAMVDNHGSQCGFCTPGFVMSLFAMSKLATSNQGDFAADDADARAQIHRYLGGNLCRCTGYRPIVDAALKVIAISRPSAEPASRSEGAVDKFDRNSKATIETLGSIEPQAQSNGFFRPDNIAELCELRSRYPDAPLVAGGTDLSLEVTQRLRRFAKIICIQQVSDLDYFTSDENNLYIGPGCNIEKLCLGLRHLGQDIVTLLHRFGATQVRNQATVGGSIANASPIGDLAPVFISMDATLVLQSVDGQRQIPLEEFFLGYRQTQLRDNEIVREIIVPRCVPDSNNPGSGSDANYQLKVYKVSKRIEDDISTVCASFYLHRDADRIHGIRTGFGGMAAIPMRSAALEAAVAGKEVNPDLFTHANAAFASDFEPISDARASAAYRLEVVQNLFRRLCIETGDQSTLTRVGEHV